MLIRTAFVLDRCFSTGKIKRFFQKTKGQGFLKATLGMAVEVVVDLLVDLLLLPVLPQETSPEFFSVESLLVLPTFFQDR